MTYWYWLMSWYCNQLRLSQPYGPFPLRLHHLETVAWWGIKLCDRWKLQKLQLQKLVITDSDRCPWGLRKAWARSLANTCLTCDIFVLVSMSVRRFFSNTLILFQVSTLPCQTILKWYCHAIRRGFGQCPHFWIHVQTQLPCEGSSWSALVLWLRLMHRTQSAWGRRPGRSCCCKKPLEPLRFATIFKTFVFYDCVLLKPRSLQWISCRSKFEGFGK